MEEQENVTNKQDMDELSIAKLNAESEQLLSIFPKELWDHVIDQLADSPENFEGLSNSSPFFRELLKPKRVLFLFPKVLLQQLATQELYHTIDEIKGGQGKRVISSILKCRSVCSTWANSVDDLIENGSNVAEFEKYWKLIQPVRNSLSFDTKRPARLTYFLNHFEKTHPQNGARSPFIGRCVDVFFRDTYHYYPEFTSELQYMFHNYGHHVLELRIGLEENTDDQAYEIVRDFLAPLQNLKELTLCHQGGLYGYIGSFPVLRDKLRDHPLPHLHSLEKLTAIHVPTVFVNELIRKSRQLSTFDVRRNGVDEDEYDFSAILTLNLKSLVLDFHSVNFFRDVCRSLEAASQLGLTTLSFLFHDLENPNADTFVPFAEICQLIHNKCSETLESLTLYAPEATCCEDVLSILRDSTIFRLSLPKVRRLKLDIQNRIHLDFLLPMKDSLQQLTIAVNMYQESNCRECETSGVCNANEELKEEKNTPIIQFEGYENRMLESNIWNLFPNLDTLSVKVNRVSTGLYSNFKHTRHQLMEQV